MTTELAGARTSHRLPWRSAARYVVAALVIGILAFRFGPTPFVDAFTAVNIWLIGVALVLAALTTACSALRWRAVSTALKLPLPLMEAFTAYYRSQLLNAALPGGVLGDVDRGFGQRRDDRPLSRTLRAVAWERMLGQATELVMAVGVLVAAPTPLRAALSATSVAIAIAAMLAIAATILTLRRGRSGRYRGRGYITRLMASDWQAMRATPHTLTIIVATSVGATLGYVLFFLLAARSVGVTADPLTLVAVALTVLVIAALPLNVAGWGPREGAAAWLFAAAGLSAAQGLAVSVLFGVLTLIGVLPGALVLVVGRRRMRHA